MLNLCHLGSGVNIHCLKSRRAGHSHFDWPSAVAGAAIGSEGQALSTKFATSNHENGPLSYLNIKRPHFLYEHWWIFMIFF